MSDLPPLRKPRHADGRPMSEDKIRGLDGRELDLHVNCCIVDGDPVWLLPQNRSRVLHYSTDIAAAFTVNRTGWRWYMNEDGPGDQNDDWTLYVAVRQPEYSDYSVVEKKTTPNQPTPADHAKARCIAALLLAAKIGE